ncbi:MAG: TolC family protein, partial [Acidobacteriota bacterium]
MRALPVFAVLLAMAVHTSAEADAQTPPTTTSIFLGGVPSGTRTDTSLTISIQEAMTRALAHNLGVLTAEAEVEHAQGRRRRELSALLPNVSGRVSETRQQINLQAFGFGGFGDAFAGVPTVVGPFNVFDARVYVSQAVVDVGATENARAEAHNVRAAQHMYEGSRDFVVWVTGNLYLQALAASARVDSARAQRDTAQALYTQAVD